MIYRITFLSQCHGIELLIEALVIQVIRYYDLFNCFFFNILLIIEQSQGISKIISKIISYLRKHSYVHIQNCQIRMFIYFLYIFVYFSLNGNKYSVVLIEYNMNCFFCNFQNVITDYCDINSENQV